MKKASNQKSEDSTHNVSGAMDAEYRKMMLWVAIALVASVVAALVIVTLVIHHYGP